MSLRHRKSGDQQWPGAAGLGFLSFAPFQFLSCGAMNLVSLAEYEKAGKDFARLLGEQANFQKTYLSVAYELAGGTVVDSGDSGPLD